MKTMGFSDLALVRPRRFPDPQAEWRAAGAKDVLEETLVVDGLGDAVADSIFVAGTTARPRRMSWRLATPRDAAPELLEKARHGQVSVLFGREADGLTNEELDMCHLHLRIPASEAYGSLNLAMSVQILCYELRLALLEGQGELVLGEKWDRPPASTVEIERLFEHCETLIAKLDFLPGEHHAVVMRRIRRLMSRIEPDVTEVSMLRGLISAIERQLKGPK